MSLNIFDKMLARYTALAISVLYIQVSCSQQNGSNILSNLVLNNSAGIQTQGNIIQKSLNQFAKNRILPANLQQTVNSQKSQNLQGANVQQLVNSQTLNSQQLSNLQAVSTQQPYNLQSVTTQQPMHLQSGKTQALNLQAVNTQQPLNVQAVNNQQQAIQNIQPTSNFQQSLPIQQQPMNLQQTPSINQNSVQQNMNAQNQNQNLGNVQILRQFSDVSSPVSNGQYVQICQGTNTPSCPTTTSTAPTTSTSLCINNSGGEAVPVICPQNQQVSISGMPAYVIDAAQISNALPASIASSQGNQPTVLTILGVPQQNQQSIDVIQSPVMSTQNATPNQIKIIKSVQPHTTSAQKQDQNQMGVLSPATSQARPSSHSDILPTVTSMLVSSLSKQASKSSSLKALLPLVLNLIKEKNSCGCNHNCGCPNNPNHYENNNVEGYKSYSKPKRYGYKQMRNPKYSNDDSEEFDDYDIYENQRNKETYRRHRKAKPESVETCKEYDYSDEYHDDY